MDRSLFSRESDGAALCELMATFASSGALSTWCIGPGPFNPCDNWTGIRCSVVGGGVERVTYLDLFSLGLDGNLTSSIGNLDALQTLYLGFNSFGGSLPSSLGRLGALTSLGLNYNAFTSTMPTTVAQLTNLRGLHVAGNKLTGPLPELTRLSLLQIVEIQDNSLNGTLNHLAQLGSTLQHIDASDNSLSGSLFNFSGTYFDISQNNIEGSIDLLALLDNPEIQAVKLGGNKLAGCLSSASLSGFASLTHLSLDSNRITGSLPTEIGLLTALEHLNLGANLLEGPIVSQIASLSALTSLELGSTSLSGTIPSLIGLMSNLQVLDISNNNQLSGAVPSSFCSFPHSVTLLLESTPRLTCLPACLYSPEYNGVLKDKSLTEACSYDVAPRPTSSPSASPASHRPTTGGNSNYHPTPLTPLTALPTQERVRTNSSTTRVQVGLGLEALYSIIAILSLFLFALLLFWGWRCSRRRIGLELGLDVIPRPSSAVEKVVSPLYTEQARRL